MNDNRPPDRSHPRQTVQEKVAKLASTAQLTSADALISIHPDMNRVLSSLDEVEHTVSRIAEDSDELSIRTQDKIQSLKEQTRKLREYVHRTEQFLQITVGVQKPELSLVQSDVVYRLLDVERDTQILFALTTLFLGLFLATITGPGRTPSDSIGGLTQAEILEFLVTVIFTGLTIRAFIQGRVKKQEMAKNIQVISFVPKVEE